MSGSAATADASASSGLGRILGQGALVTGAFLVSQAASFARNAVLGHWLAKGDFGVAALITLTLQMVEVLSDLAADRMIVQDEDGDAAHLMATLHTVQVARGFALALLLAAGGGLIAHAFSVADATLALQAMALVPLVKGFQHLDFRRRQRTLDNRGFALVEAVPQIVALALIVPALLVRPGYGIVVLLALAQAAVAVFLSHWLATRPYRLAFDRPVLHRLMRFSWPIWASAVPLVAVYQGDRLIVGQMLGIEALAGYSVAFMMAMVPGLLAAKLGTSLMLPLLASARSAPAMFAARFRIMVAVTVAWAAAYLAGFVVAGGALAEIAFGANYAGLGTVAGWLGLMWSLRMVQAVPGMALMTLGDTRPLLTAGVLRALALAPAAMLAARGHGLEAVAAAGVAGEIASFAWLTMALERRLAGLGGHLAKGIFWLVPAGASALIAVVLLDGGDRFGTTLLVGVAAAVVTGVAVLAGEPVTRRYLVSLPALRNGVAARS
ncbi:MAG: oligosaccharide flippase family protein [Hyphomicrobiaceae bacterium]